MVRDVVAVGGTAKSEKRVPTCLRPILGEEWKRYIHERGLTGVTFSGPDVDDDALIPLAECRDLRFLDF